MHVPLERLLVLDSVGVQESVKLQLGHRPPITHKQLKAIRNQGQALQTVKHPPIQPQIKSKGHRVPTFQVVSRGNTRSVHLQLEKTLGDCPTCNVVHHVEIRSRNNLEVGTYRRLLPVSIVGDSVRTQETQGRVHHSGNPLQWGLHIEAKNQRINLISRN